MASFDLAWCAAESTGARFAAEYAGKAAAATGDGVCLEERMALVFCAEALQNIHNRLRARPQSFGLNDADVAAWSLRPSAVSARRNWMQAIWKRWAGRSLR
jgi:hypothetical protein